MSKFCPKKSGNKYQKDKVTSYMLTLSISLLKDAGFLVGDSICEYEAVATYSDRGNQMVIELRKKESEA